MSKTALIDASSTSYYFYIKFYPGIKSSIGCEKAALILGRLEYWFEKYAHGFYKFVEPCSHPLYREGDSWSEEIGFPRKIFARAFDLIGVRYKSKSAFLRSEDKFQGKLYASYHDRKTNQTYFIRNHEFASQFIKSLFTTKASLSNSKHSTNKLTAVDEAISCFNGRSRKGKNVRSSGGTIGGKPNKPIQRNTSSLENVTSGTSNALSKPSKQKVTEEMINIWKEEVGELGVCTISSRLLNQLFETLKRFFDQSLEAWKNYCRMISSSKFLMGEAQNKFFKKAWITWAIKEESIEKVRGGGFKLGDRQTRTDKEIQELEDSLNTLKAKKFNIEDRIESIKTEAQKERLEKVREKIKALSAEEMEQFKAEFQSHLTLENNSITQEFKRAGWNGLFVETYFESYMEERVAELMFKSSIEEEAMRRIKTSGFQEMLDSVSENIIGLRRTRQTMKETKIEVNEESKGKN